MKSSNFLQRVLFLFVFALVGLSAFAQTGTRTHVVKSGETLYRISKTYGVSMEDIVAANPGLTAEGLKVGATLNLPAGASSEVTTQSVKTGDGNVRAALVLPISATGIEGGRSLEFYRGFIMAAQQVQSEGCEVSIFGYDEKSDVTSMVSILDKMKANKVQTFVGPVYPKHFAEMAQFARTNRMQMVVPFYSKAEQVNTNPYVALINAPEKFENELVVDLFLKTFKDCNVAIMHVGSANKQGFVQYLRKRLLALGVSVTEFSYDSPLEQMHSACNAKKTTVIVPDAGDADALSKTIAKMEGFKKYYPSYPTKLFGYPEWLDKAGDYADALYANNSYLYTDAFYNPYDKRTKDFEAKYEQTFNAAPDKNVHPCMALLGYDTGLHLLRGVAKHGNQFATQATGSGQLQSEVRFERIEQDGGLINNSLFFIHYRTDRNIDKIAPNRK